MRCSPLVLTTHACALRLLALPLVQPSSGLPDSLGLGLGPAAAPASNSLMLGPGMPQGDDMSGERRQGKGSRKILPMAR